LALYRQQEARSFAGDPLPLFGVSEAQLDEYLRQVDGVSKLAETALSLLEQLDERISRLESTPSPTGVVDSLAARLDSIAAEMRADSHSHSDAIEELDRRLVQITLAVAEGIERVDRAERRVRSTVKRARKELAEQGYESDGLEAEDAEIRLSNGPGGGEGGVPPLRLGLGETGADGVVVITPEHPQPKGIPGHFSQEVLKALRS